VAVAVAVSVAAAVAVAMRATVTVTGAAEVAVVVVVVVVVVAAVVVVAPAVAVAVAMVIGGSWKVRRGSSGGGSVVDATIGPTTGTTAGDAATNDAATTNGAVDTCACDACALAATSAAAGVGAFGWVGSDVASTGSVRTGAVSPAIAATTPVARVGTRVRTETGLVTGVSPRVGVGVCGLVVVDERCVSRAVDPPPLVAVEFTERSASNGLGLALGVRDWERGRGVWSSGSSRALTRGVESSRAR
jgi:hypothetical protein